MSLFEIRQRYNGAVLFSRECGSLRLCLEAAVKSGAYLSRADLSGAKGADYAIACTRILPDGDLIGWKNANGTIIKLRIPAESQRSHAFGRKCRAEFVIDMGHWDKDGKALPNEHEAYTDQTSQGGSKATYKYGDKIVADKWDEDFENECSHGIHFFITRLEAENWQ